MKISRLFHLQIIVLTAVKFGSILQGRDFDKKQTFS